MQVQDGKQWMQVKDGKTVDASKGIGLAGTGRLFKIMAAEHKINIGGNEADAFQKYADMLVEWNEKINLTSIEDTEEIILKHFIDSLCLVERVKEFGNGRKKVIDVGTGAGFPGLPIKIHKQNLDLVLLDSLSKRVEFLKAIIASLGIIKGITVMHMRAEDAARDIKLREKFDIAIARAVAPLPVLLEYCLPFVKMGGLFLAMKGPEPDMEVTSSSMALEELGGAVEGIDRYFIGENQGRSIIKIKKIRHISPKYPRKAGIPSRKPL